MTRSTGFSGLSTSYGSFWYGNSIGFPGFIYKKNTGVGRRKICGKSLRAISPQKNTKK